MLEWRARFLSFFQTLKIHTMITQGNSTKKNLDNVVDQIGNDQKMNKNRAIVWIVLIVAMVVVAIFVSCTTSHRVSQSASTFKSGDTLTTTIIYQQTGNLRKR
jgi:cytochrome c-type biogenesis protein CcmH/NrfF